MKLHVNVFDDLIIIKSRGSEEGVRGRIQSHLVQGDEIDGVPFDQLKKIRSGWYESLKAITEAARNIADGNEDSPDSSA